MNLGVVNNTDFKQLKLVCCGREHLLKDGAHVIIEDVPCDVCLEIMPLDKHECSVLLWVFGILLEFFNSILGDASFNISLKTTAIYDLHVDGEYPVVELKRFSAGVSGWTDYYYEYVYLSQKEGKVDVKEVDFKINPYSKEKAKYFFVNIILWSIIMLPIIIVLSLSAMIVPAVILLVIYVFFTVRRIKKGAYYFNDKSASAKLRQEYADRFVFDIKMSAPRQKKEGNFINRIIESLLDKVFTLFQKA